MSLLGSLGGALSLYLGCALVMLFELLELGIDIGLNLWRHKRGHKEKQGTEKPDTCEVRIKGFLITLKNRDQVSDAELEERIRIVLWANGFRKSKFP